MPLRTTDLANTPHREIRGLALVVVLTMRRTSGSDWSRGRPLRKDALAMTKFHPLRWASTRPRRDSTTSHVTSRGFCPKVLAAPSAVTDADIEGAPTASAG